jgi:hypothetical protein
MKYEIRLTNVPDGAYTEDYLGDDREVNSKAEARRVIAQFRRAMRQNPENFEPGMTASVVDLRTRELVAL